MHPTDPVTDRSGPWHVRCVFRYQFADLLQARLLRHLFDSAADGRDKYCVGNAVQNRGPREAADRGSAWQDKQPALSRR